MQKVRGIMMRFEKAIRKYPYVAYNPATHTFKGYWTLGAMIGDYEKLYKESKWVNGMVFFEEGEEIKL
jgi:hypothetical protein